MDRHDKKVADQILLKLMSQIGRVPSNLFLCIHYMYFKTNIEMHLSNNVPDFLTS